jgi:hypothetical protein
MDQVSSAEPGTPEKGPVEPGSKEIGSAQVGFAEESGFEIGLAQICTAQIRLDRWMLLSPCIPSVRSLLEKVKLLLISHMACLLCDPLLLSRIRLYSKLGTIQEEYS